MKRILLTLGMAMILVSCSKSVLMPQNVKYHNVFVGMKGHDNLPRGNSVFCVAGDTVKLRDTIDIVTFTAPDPNKFDYRVGSIYVVVDPFDTSRNYWLLKEFVKSWVENL